MAELINKETNKFEEIPEDKIGDAILSGKYSFRKGDRVNVIEPETGDSYSVPVEEAKPLFKQGYRAETLGEMEERKLKKEYGDSPIQTFVERGLSSATLGGTDFLIKNISPDTAFGMGQRERFNPGSAILGEVAGFLTPFGVEAAAEKGLIKGGGVLAKMAEASPVSLASKLGKGVEESLTKEFVKAASKSGPLGALAKAAPRLAGVSAEAAALGMGEGLSEYSLGDPNEIGASVIFERGLQAALTAPVLVGGFDALLGGAKMITKPMFQKIEKTLAEKGGTKAALEQFSYRSAVDALGGKKTLDKKILKSGLDDLELGKILVEDGLIMRGGQEIGEIADNVSAKKEQIGKTIGDIYNQTDDVVRSIEENLSKKGQTSDILFDRKEAYQNIIDKRLRPFLSSDNPEEVAAAEKVLNHMKDMMEKGPTLKRDVAEKAIFTERQKTLKAFESAFKDKFKEDELRRWETVKDFEGFFKTKFKQDHVFVEGMKEYAADKTRRDILDEFNKRSDELMNIVKSVESSPKESMVTAQDRQKLLDYVSNGFNNGLDNDLKNPIFDKRSIYEIRLKQAQEIEKRFEKTILKYEPNVLAGEKPLVFGIADDVEKKVAPLIEGVPTQKEIGLFMKGEKPAEVDIGYFVGGKPDTKLPDYEWFKNVPEYRNRIGFKQAWEEAKVFDDLSKFDQMRPGPLRQAYREIRDEMRDMISTSFDKASKIDPSLVNSTQVKELNKKYRYLSFLDGVTDDAIAAAKGNRKFSLSDYLTAGAAFSGGTNAALSFLVGSVHKYFRQNGSKIMAVGANRLAKMAAIENLQIRSMKKIGTAINKFISAPSVLVSGKAIPFAQRQSSYEDQSKKRSLKDRYEKAVKFVSNQNEQTVIDSLAGKEQDDESDPGLWNISPETMQSITQSAVQSINFLKQNIPEDPNALGVFKESEWQPSRQQMQDFLHLYEGAMSPGKVIEKMGNGEMPVQAFTAMKQLHPVMFQMVQQKMIDQIAKKQGKDIPYEKRVAISMALGSPLEKTMDPRFIMQQQMMYAQTGQEPNRMPVGSRSQPTQKARKENLKNTTTFSQGLSKQMTL